MRNSIDLFHSKRFMGSRWFFGGKDMTGVHRIIMGLFIGGVISTFANAHPMAWYLRIGGGLTGSLIFFWIGFHIHRYKVSPIRRELETIFWPWRMTEMSEFSNACYVYFGTAFLHLWLSVFFGIYPLLQ